MTVDKGDALDDLVTAVCVGKPVLGHANVRYAVSGRKRGMCGRSSAFK